MKANHGVDYSKICIYIYNWHHHGTTITWLWPWNYLASPCKNTIYRWLHKHNNMTMTMRNPNKINISHLFVAQYFQIIQRNLSFTILNYDSNKTKKIQFYNKCVISCFWIGWHGPRLYQKHINRGNQWTISQLHNLLLFIRKMDRVIRNKHWID